MNNWERFNCIDRDSEGKNLIEFLASYRPKDYKHPALTADIAVFCKRLGGYKLLLIQRKNHPCINCFALPGGFVEEGERALFSAIRELNEETSVVTSNLVSVGLFSDTERDPRDWVVSECFATVITPDTAIKAGDDAKKAQWFDLNYTYANDSIELWLTHPSLGLLSANLRVERVIIEKKVDYNLEIIQNNGLAFDHAKMIAKAILVCLIG